MIVKILEPAEKEVKEAFNFYNSQFDGLGHKFIESFLLTIELIEKIPFGWRKVSPNTRRINIKDFPYLILYAIEEDKIIVTFVCHSHRDPRYYRRYFK